MSVSISLQNLTKVYGRSTVAAVDDVSLNVEAGQVYGFLGSNGAGKSTAIRLMLDFIRPTSGSISILDRDSVKDSMVIKRNVGYLAGDVVLPKKVTGRQILNYLSKLSGGVDGEYLKVLENRFEAQLDKKVETLSKGNRQKIGIIQAFMHQPKVIILDEPTSGLDPLMQERFYETIKEAKSSGAAIFLSSHSLSEVERICDRIGIIRKGKLVYEGTMDELSKHRTVSWQVTVGNQADIERLINDPDFKIVSHAGNDLVLQPVNSIAAGLAALSKVDVLTLETKKIELEEMFMNFYDKDSTQ